MAFLDPELCFAEEVPSEPPPRSPGTSLAGGEGAVGSPHCLHFFRGSQDFCPRLGNRACLDKGSHRRGGPARSLVAAQNLQPAALRPVLGGVPAVEP